MAKQDASYSPAGWSPVEDHDGHPVTGCWVKELCRGWDSFTMLRLDADASLDTALVAGDRLLVVDGTLAVATGEADGPEVHRHGAYVALPREPRPRVSSIGGSGMGLLLSGSDLGEPIADIFSPAGWRQGSPGMWALPVVVGEPGTEREERVVGFAYIEPGSAADRHDHPTVHRFLFLDGEAEDEMVHPDGRRETADRRKGDFVEYETGILHRTFTRTGCTLLFVHEPLAANP